MGTGEFNAGAYPVMDQHPIQRGVEMLLVILKKLIALSISKKNASQSVQHSERTANLDKMFPSRAFMLDILFYILRKSEYSRQAHDGTNSS